MSTQVAPIANVQPSQLTNEQTLSLQYPPNNQIEDLNKVLDDVNVIKSKQKIVDESLSSVKKYIYVCFYYDYICRWLNVLIYFKCVFPI